MLFNFGDQPWKYPPLEGYVGFAQVPSKHIVPNTKKGSATQTRKIVNNAPQALIIEPSRELAEQTFEQIKKFKKHLDSPNIRELLVVGGMRVDDQIRALEAGVDIVVATPGIMPPCLVESGLLPISFKFFLINEMNIIFRTIGRFDSKTILISNTM